MTMAITNELYGSYLFWLLIIFLSVTLSAPLLLSRVYRHVYKEPEIYAHKEISDPDCEKGCLSKVEDEEDNNDISSKD